jgi:hypothetical protein
MFETLSVDQALARGRRIINYPVWAIMLLFFTAGFCATVFFKMSGWYTAGGMFGGFVVAWLYWSFMIPKWRVWAFDNVRNVHELNKRAISEKLIWPESSVWNKTEIWLGGDRAKWAALQAKFARRDIFTEDFSIPSETVIYFSQNKLMQDIIALILVTIGGIFFLLKTEHIYYGLLGLLGPIIYFFVDTNRKLKVKTPQITINDKSLKTSTIPFHEWDLITGEDIISEGSGKNLRYYFVFVYPTGLAKIEIISLDITRRNLENLLRIYRGRAAGKTQRQSISTRSFIA